MDCSNEKWWVQYYRSIARAHICCLTLNRCLDCFMKIGPCGCMGVCECHWLFTTCQCEWQMKGTTTNYLMLYPSNVHYILQNHEGQYLVADSRRPEITRRTRPLLPPVLTLVPHLKFSIDFQIFDGSALCKMKTASPSQSWNSRPGVLCRCIHHICCRQA